MNYIFRPLTLSAALICSVVIFGSQPLLADEFKPQQKKEIEHIVRDYLIKNPEILKEVIIALEQKEKAQAQAIQQKALKAHANWLFNSKQDYVAGNKKGDITLVEFFDYNCGYCKRAVPELLGLMKKDPKIRIVLKEMPILGPASIFASQAALASKKQNKYWDFHLALLNNEGPNNETNVMRIAKEVGLDTEKLKKDMATPDITRHIAEIEAKSQALGIRSTPAFILDDQVYPGALPQQVLLKLVADLRKSGGCKLC